MLKLRCLVLLCVLPIASGQDVPRSYPYIRPNQEVRIPDLLTLQSPTKDRADVLLTSLEIIFHDPTICCGRDSALQHSASRADPRSVKDIVTKLQGRQLLSDGRPILVTAVDLAPSSPNPAPIVDALTKNHALLMMWNSHLYIAYGASFDDALYSDGTQTTTINKLLLIDVRYSDSRRELAFSRTADDWSKVEGLLLFAISQQ